jgi:hypothetical protein
LLGWSVTRGLPGRDAIHPGGRALSPGQQDPAAFTTLVADAEEVLATELSGWVQQMNDAMRELSARPEDRPADAAHAPVPAARQAPDR